MELEKQKSPICAVSTSTEKLMKNSKELSNTNGKPPAILQKTTNHKQKRNRRVKLKAAEQPPPQSAQPTSTVTNTQINPELHKNVIHLHDRAKIVRSKLITMKEKLESTETVCSFEQISQDLTEDAIRKEIKRLRLLMKELRLKDASQQDTEKRISVGSDAEPRDATTDNRPERRSRRKREPKKSQKPEKVVVEKQLQLLYETHINQIVSGTNTEDPKYKDLQFKLGDDLEQFAQKCVDAGLGNIIEAAVRVNAKNNHQAFLTSGGDTDAMITSMAARKYALDGDLVRAFVRNSSEASKIDIDEGESAVEVTDDDPEEVLINDVVMLKESEAISPPQNRAFVIRIVKSIGNRVTVGSIAFKNPVKIEKVEFFKFQPHDMKVPMIYIPVLSCQAEANAVRVQQSLRYLFLAEIIEIKDKGRCIGKLLEPVGTCGNLEDEIKAILLHNGLKDVRPFEERFENMWLTTKTEIDLRGREDLRNECIFTIDPLTARDLDDAVSCKPLENGQYEIGVHISDVSYFLEENSELDELVMNRATSIYLVNEVIHMLPKTLCFKCSLLPDEEKYAFSVFWTMNEKAEIISTRFARTVIRSCTQLAYEHAQKILDNPQEEFSVDDFPTICNGFQVKDILDRVRKLNEFAVLMRTKRFENGSLSIDKPQLSFQLDPKTGEPISFGVGDRKEANFLIEEFMLLANQSVAKFIYKRFPETSFLRRHEPPKPSALKKLQMKLSTSGIKLDLSSSKSIYEGLLGICGTSASPQAMAVAMNFLLTKPMMRAKYVCSEGLVTEEDLYHYALAIPIYTHFTSPIRRYPDVLVHRLLAAALDLTPPPKRNVQDLHNLASICNEQKLNAKNAGDDSANLFFKRYVNAKKYVKMEAVVIAIYRRSIEVITLETGHLITIQFKFQKTIVDASNAPHAISLSEKNSTKAPVKIEMFSVIQIKLMMVEDKLTGFFFSPDSEQRLKNMANASKGPDETSRTKKPRVRNSEKNKESTASKASKVSKHVKNASKSEDTKESTQETPPGEIKAESVDESTNKTAPGVPKSEDIKDSALESSPELLKSQNLKESTKETAFVSEDAVKSVKEIGLEHQKSECVDNVPKSMNTASPDERKEENIGGPVKKTSPMEPKTDDIKDSAMEPAPELSKSQNIGDSTKETEFVTISEDAVKSEKEIGLEHQKSECVDNVPKSMNTASRNETKEENIGGPLKKTSPMEPKTDDIKDSAVEPAPELSKSQNIGDSTKETAFVTISEDAVKSEKEIGLEHQKSECVDNVPKSMNTASRNETKEENIGGPLKKTSPMEPKTDDIKDSAMEPAPELSKSQNIDESTQETKIQLPKSEDAVKYEQETRSEAAQ